MGPNVLLINSYYKWKIRKISIALKEDFIVSILKSRYGVKLRKIKRKYYDFSISNNYDGLISNMRKHQKLIIHIIEDVLSFFDETKLCDCIFLNGSFSRFTCTYGSDVDFNLIYDSMYKDILFPIELKINYILSCVLNFRGCDRIHSMMVYTERMDNNYVELYDNKYLLYKNDSINYFCRNNYEELLSDTFNTCRDYSVLVNYLNSNICSGNIFNEWLYNFNVLYEGNSKFSNCINDNFYNVKTSDDFSDKLFSCINSLIEKYRKSEFESIYVDGKISISKLKKRYKSNIINCLNSVILMFNYCNSDVFLDVYSLINSGAIGTNLKNCIMHALVMINRLHIVLDRFDCDLSSHSTHCVSEDSFSKKYFDIYGSDYINDLSRMENAVYSECISYFEDVKSSLEK